MNPRQIAIKDYTYQLPDERIAHYPLPERDASKLLVYKNGHISEDTYRNLNNYLPDNTTLWFNNTRVIPARLFFTTQTGAKVEIFCLEPLQHTDISAAMLQTGATQWNCMIGRANKWKEKVLTLTSGGFTLNAEILSRDANAFVVEFTWQPVQFSFAEILEQTGMMPIPPYLKRQSESLDANRYQTVYAKHKGSVAAPTAGLHFTNTLLSKLKETGIETQYLTLHVGAGTFKPVKAEHIGSHEMHAELLEVQMADVEAMMKAIAENRKIVSVGTTTLRTLESLYWMGVKAFHNPAIELAQLEIKQWEVYEIAPVPVINALSALLGWMKQQGSNRLLCKTQILIAPGYELKIADGLITNFHQPNSTLLLLVAAVIGNNWKKVYDYALQHHFRFLSYGDGSLLWKQNTA